MTLLTNIETPSTSYHDALLKHLIKSKCSSETTVLLRSGEQEIVVQAVLLRNASNFLKQILSTPCSCMQMMLLLPDSPPHALATLAQLMHEGVASGVPSNVAESVVLLAKDLGIEQVVKTDISVVNDTDDLDCSVEFSATPIGATDLDESELVDPGDIYTDESEDDSSNFGKLKLKTEVKFLSESVHLKLPNSRIGRNIERYQEKSCEQFKSDPFKQRLQKEYNSHPVGQYMGPYDQSENLKLSAQLPNSQLEFKTYTQFSHDGNECYNFKVTNYENLNVLDKIDAYIIDSKAESPEEALVENDVDIVYTCQHRKCRIPCPCAHCCSDMVQCTEHKLCHPALFDSKLHAVSIRSSDAFCKEETFFDCGYIIEYAGIPINCRKCKRDLLNHHSYHFESHANCRFCNPTFFKTKASTEKELRFLIKDEAEYFKTVCQYCDRRFCDAYLVKRHIQTEHGVKPFKCMFCSKTFQSAKAKCYHERTVHCDPVKSISCVNCDQKFKAEVHLRQHEKFVHSDIRKVSCPECDAKFKQKKNMKAHMLKVHKEDYIKEDYRESSERVKEYKCKECISVFKYERNLNAHVRNIHVNDLSFPCDMCESTFSNKSNLVAHRKRKQGSIYQSLDIMSVLCAGRCFLKKIV